MIPSPISSLLAVLLTTAALATPARAQAPAPAYNPPPIPTFTPQDFQPQPPAPATPPVPPQVPDTAAPEAVPAPSLERLGKSLQNYFTEDELRLLFQYMQESVIAAFKGEEVALAPDLAFKLEVLYVRIQKEGNQYMSHLMKQLERDLDRALKDQFGPKPPAGAQAEAPGQQSSPPQNPTP